MARDTKTPEKPYLGAAELDALARTNTELLSELWILRDRVLILEHLLSKAGLIDENTIDQFVPPPELAQKLERERDRLVARVAGAAHREQLDVTEIKKNA